MHLPETVREILRKLETAGHQAYAVGGCVRDSILGKEPDDWDITTDARPEEVKDLFPRTVDTGLQHGTVTVLMGGEGYEVTTYRIDGAYTDGRHPDSIRFTPSLEEDLKRRDFTINAMAVSERGELVDLFGGQEDLRQGCIRCVGDARERFREDALRMLRAVRFAAQLNFAIEAESFAAIAELSENLKLVSKERILAELSKLLLSDHPEKAELLYESGLAPQMATHFPGFHPDYRTATLPKEKALRFAAASEALLPAELAALLKELKSDRAARPAFSGGTEAPAALGRGGAQEAPFGHRRRGLSSAHVPQGGGLRCGCGALFRRSLGGATREPSRVAGRHFKAGRLSRTLGSRNRRGGSSCARDTEGAGAR